MRAIATFTHEGSDLTCDVTTVAAFSANPLFGSAPLTVNFDSGGGFGAPVSYAWDFGDGNTSGVPNPSHTFTVADEYLVTLTATDEFGRQTTQAQMINATNPNQLPVAVATAIRIPKFKASAPA